MLRITALNRESSTSSDSDEDSPRITREAQEEITLSKYNKSLIFQREGKLDNALYLLKEITEEDLVKLEDKDGLPKKFVSLKYSCFRNIGTLFQKKLLFATALDYYLDAAEIDNTDVTLWHRIGCLAIKQEDFILASQAFEKGLECSPKHWPCLDNLIMVLYGLHEEISCLWYIDKALVLNNEYLRGLTIKNRIYKENKAIKEYYEKLNPERFDIVISEDILDEEEGEKLLAESTVVSDKVREQIKALAVPSVPDILPLSKPLEEYTWLDVGNTLLHMHQYIHENNLSLFSPLGLNSTIVSKEESLESDGVDDVLDVSVQINGVGFETEEKMEVDQASILEELSLESPANEIDINTSDMCRKIIEFCISKIEVSNENGDELAMDIQEEESIPIDSSKCDINLNTTDLKSDEDLVQNINPEPSVLNLDFDCKADDVEIESASSNNEHENYKTDALNQQNEEIIQEATDQEIEELSDDMKNMESPTEYSSMLEDNLIEYENDNEEEEVETDDIDELVKITAELEKSAEKGELLSQEIEEFLEMDATEHLEIEVPMVETFEPVPEFETENTPNENADITEEKSDVIAEEIILASQNDTPENLEAVDVAIDDIPAIMEEESPDNMKPTVIESVPESIIESKSNSQDGNEEDKTLTQNSDLNQETDRDEGGTGTETDNLEESKRKTVKSKQNRRRRSSLSMLEVWGWHKNRRSKRSKSGKVIQREPRDNTLKGSFRRIIPCYLMPLQCDPESEISTAEKTCDISENISKNNSEEKNEEYFGSIHENNDVKVFWENFALHFETTDLGLRCDIITMLEHYVPAIAAKWDLTWPAPLINVYMQAYELYRRYHQHPCVLSTSNSDVDLKKDAEVTLLYGELLQDQWLTTNNKQPRPMVKPLPIQSEAQIWFIAVHEAEWTETIISFITRVHFLKTLIYVNKSNNMEAIDILKRMLDKLQSNNCDDSFEISLPNCINNKKINIKQLKKLLNSLERYESLSKMVDWYEKRCYNEIIPILKENFNAICDNDGLDPSPGGADQPMQIVMLLDALWSIDNLQDCIIWAEKGLNVAIEKFLVVVSPSKAFDRWSTVLKNCLASIVACIQDEGLCILDAFDDKSLQQLVLNMTKIIYYQIERKENSKDPPLQTITPWIIIHYILQHGEDKGRIKVAHNDRKSSSGSDEDDDEEDVPPSLMILFIGHEYLGRRSWCSVNEGELLLFTLDVIMPILRSPLLIAVRERITQSIEQILYCLYQHPSKKNNKVKYLLDHNVSPQKLSWERAQQLYDFFRPEEIPEFDAYKVVSISTETEGLLKRVVSLIPTEQDPQPFCSQIDAFVESRVEELPTIQPTLPSKMANIHYLLADFYFKNSEFEKAFRFYVLDLCNNPQRVDSWAGMALSRASVLETKLNSCEPLGSDGEFLDTARTVQVCFKQSLHLSPDHWMLWIEYGSFVYSVHSFCSRIMKTEADTLSMEKFETLETQKESLLKCALECFTSADTIWQHLIEINDTPEQDERWLHQYMQGKIAEKQGLEPSLYMSHYIKARDLLHENNAQYPQKINYNNPQTLAVEALEVFYRVHASVLKYLELHEKKPIPASIGQIFLSCIDQCTCGGFLLGTSKEDGERKKVDPEATPVDESTGGSLERKRTISENIPEVPNKRSKIENQAENIAEELITADSEIIIQNEKSNKLVEISKKMTTDMLELQNETTVVPQPDTEEKLPSVKFVETVVQEGMPTGEIDQPEKMVTTVVENEEVKALKEITPDSPVRRGSQESTTTTASTQGGTTGTSTETSDSSSSDDDSTDGSSSSSDSDSSEETENSKQSKSSKASSKKHIPEGPLSVEQIAHLTVHCIKRLELCICRFPQHYKALYRLAHHYFHRPGEARDLIKCRQLLLGQYTCTDGALVQGLFQERKNNNFFNGVWRIPVSEMDRPGSFASHMSRCVTLLMQVLRASGDHRTLLELCLQLRRTPDADKKYLRESEREQLSQQALSLCIQCLRELLRAVSSGKYIATTTAGTNTIVNEPPGPTSPQQSVNWDPNPAATLLIDIFRAYQKTQKCLEQKQSLFSSLLSDTYKQYMAGKLPEGVNVVDLAVKFCQQRLAANRLATQQANNQSNPLQPSVQVGAVINSIQPQVPTQKRPAKSSSGISGRPRGRPPGSGKQDYMSANRYNKYASAASTLNQLNLTTQSSLGYYPFHPMLMSAASMGSMANMDTSAAALSLMMSNYQDLMRNYSSTMSLPQLPQLPNLTQDIATSLLKNYPSVNPTTVISPAHTLNAPVKYSQKVPNTSKDLTKPTSFNPKDITKMPCSSKEPPKPKAPNKDSILKAVYGKEKTTTRPKDPTKVDTMKRDTNLFKDRPYLSVTQILQTAPIPMTAPRPTAVHFPGASGKTLQQKLAERQKQNSPIKSNITAPVDPLLLPPHREINFSPVCSQASTFNSVPPAAHTQGRTTPFSAGLAPLPAHSNTSPIKSTPSANTYSMSGSQSSPVPKKLKLSNDIVPPAYLSMVNPAAQLSPPARHSDNISITQMKKPNMGKTQKLLNYRKPGGGKIPPMPLGPPDNVAMLSPPKKLSAPPPMTKRPPDTKPTMDSSEIIVLDDD